MTHTISSDTHPIEHEIINTEITLIRHVKVVGPSALYGHTDVAAQTTDNQTLLKSLLGRCNQITNAAHFSQSANPSSHARTNTNHNVDVIISSPLQRCASLAKTLSEQAHLPLLMNEGFKEMNFGLYDGVPFDDIYQLNKESGGWATLEAFWQSPSTAVLPEAESLKDFNERVISSWQHMINVHVLDNVLDNITQQKTTQIAKQESPQQENSQKIHNNKNILIVCHGGVIRMILAYILQLDWRNPLLYQNLNIDHGSATKILLASSIAEGLISTRVNYIGLPSD